MHQGSRKGPEDNGSVGNGEWCIICNCWNYPARLTDSLCREAHSELVWCHVQRREARKDKNNGAIKHTNTGFVTRWSESMWLNWTINWVWQGRMWRDVWDRYKSLGWTNLTVSSCLFVQRYTSLCKWFINLVILSNIFGNDFYSLTVVIDLAVPSGNNIRRSLRSMRAWRRNY